MKRVPGAKKVESAIKGLGQAVKESLGAVHQQAAHAMSRGKYDVAEQFVAKGKEIQVFQAELDGLRNRWRNLRGGRPPGAAKRELTPQWKYYQPVLKALIELGGEGTREEIGPIVEGLMRSGFLANDSDRMAGGLLRWQVMIRRSRKQLLKEGWIERGHSKTWQITQSGRQAAQAMQQADN